MARSIGRSLTRPRPQTRYLRGRKPRAWTGGGRAEGDARASSARLRRVGSDRLPGMGRCPFVLPPQRDVAGRLGSAHGRVAGILLRPRADDELLLRLSLAARLLAQLARARLGSLRARGPHLL